MKELVFLGRIYDHHKGGKYLVLHIAEESTNARIREKGVVYVSLTYGTIKYRKLEEFLEEVVWPDRIRRPRFVLEQ